MYFKAVLALTQIISMVSAIQLAGTKHGAKIPAADSVHTTTQVFDFYKNPTDACMAIFARAVAWRFMPEASIFARRIEVKTVQLTSGLAVYIQFCCEDFHSTVDLWFMRVAPRLITTGKPEKEYKQICSFFMTCPEGTLPYWYTLTKYDKEYEFRGKDKTTLRCITEAQYNGRPDWYIPAVKYISAASTVREGGAAYGAAVPYNTITEVSLNAWLSTLRTGTDRASTSQLGN